MQVQHAHETQEMNPVVRWRYDQLVADGFDPLLALHLADDQRRNLHDLLELHERGCPPPLAARILAPLDLADAEAP